MNQHSPRRKQVFYVVTRDGRRTSPRDFWIYNEAEQEAKKIRAFLSRWRDAHVSRIEVVKTSSPSLIS